MWTDQITASRDATWGIHIKPLDSEAALLQAGTPCAALVDHLAVIRLSGPDAADFLQGQVTCDINQLAPGQGLLGAHCNLKGRAQATFICGRQGDDLLLLLPRDQQQPTIDALGKFAMFSKVDISAAQELLVLGFTAGDDLTTSADRVGDIVGAECFHIPHLGWLALIPEGSARLALELLSTRRIPVVGDNAWRLNRIRLGIAQIYQAQTEQWIPQELNYDLIEGVNFKKGCYKGQEIVARIHYRGQTKVRTFALEVRGGGPLAIGAKITGAGGQGTVLEVARVSETTFNVLSTLKIEDAENGDLRLNSNDEAKIRVLPLPYAIT
ncbi:MAG: hypothetical protein CML06_14780 [Pseudomonadales bacterium]|nr:hypothetical protein [Pseudomonadales bacterium]